MYGKIFDSMYEGTLYGQWEAIVTFQQMIVLCDQDGVIDMTPHAIAARTSIPLEIIKKGLSILEAPDPYSRTPGQEGRRIELLDGHRPWGWHIINHDKYRMLIDADTIRAQNRERQRRHRDSQAAALASNAASRSVTASNTSDAASRHTDTDTDTDTRRKAEGAARPARLSKDWILPKAWGEWAMKEQPTWNEDHVRKVAANFKDHWIASPRGTKLDWLATWRKWVRGEPALKGVNGAGKKPWYMTASGIETKAKELGMEIPTERAAWSTFRELVYERAGVTDEMLRAGKIDYAP